MTRSTRNLWVLVGTVAILALAVSAVVPVLAQGGGTGGQNGQGTSVPLQPGDTLGTLVSRYNLTDDNLREFFALNSGLVLQTGQTVNFPAGIIINTGAGGQGQEPTGDATVQETATVDAGGAIATGTPEAGGAVATGTPDAGGVPAGDQTYVTVEGDTLGDVLAMMGFTEGADMVATGTPEAGAEATGTPEAGGAVETGTPEADVVTTGTPEAGAVTTGTPEAGAEATGTPEAGGAVATGTPEAGAVTNEQLSDFVSLNSNLSFVSGQSFILPAGVPATGEGQVTGTPTAGVAAATGTPEAGAQATGTPGAGGQVTGTPLAGGQQTYTVQPGETLTDIANSLGVTVEELVAANPDLLTAGQTINVPAGAIPQTGVPQTFTTADGDTLGEIVSNNNLTADQLGDFFRANSGLVVTEGQTVSFPAVVPQTGQGGAAGQATTTPAVVETATPVVVETATPVVVETATPVVVETATPAAGVTTVTPTAGSVVETVAPTEGAAVETVVATAGAVVETVVPTVGVVVETATPTAGAAVETVAPTVGAVVETATPTAGAVVETVTPTAGAVVETATPAAGVATATPLAGGTTTPAAGGQGTYVTQQGDTLGDLFVQMGVDLDTATTPEDAQMFQEFVNLNSDLTFEAGQTVTIPAAVPQTGGQPAGAAAAPSLAEQIESGQRFGRLCGEDASPGTGHYLIQPGESLFSIAEKFNVAPEDIIALNPGVTVFFSGQAIVLPGAEAPGQWNVEHLNESCENWFEGGGGTGTGETTGGGENTGE